MSKIDRDEVKDCLIDKFCVPTCPDTNGCPDHDCPVWKALKELDK